MTAAHMPGNALRKHLRAYRAAVQQLREAEKPSAGSNGKRESTRVAFDARLLIVNSVDSLDHIHDRYVVPRNVSIGGVGFVYCQFMHAGLKCKVSLPTTAGDWLRVPGSIVRCRHLSGTVHEIGMQFSEPVDVSTLEGIPNNDRSRCRKEYERAVCALIASRDQKHRVVIVTMTEERATYWRGLLGTDLAEIELTHSLEGSRAALNGTATDACVLDRLPTVQGMTRIITSLRKVNARVPLIALLNEDELEQDQLLLAHGATACLPVSTTREDLILMVLQQCDIRSHRNNVA